MQEMVRYFKTNSLLQLILFYMFSQQVPSVPAFRILASWIILALQDAACTTCRSKLVNIRIFARAFTLWRGHPRCINITKYIMDEYILVMTLGIKISCERNSAFSGVKSDLLPSSNTSHRWRRLMKTRQGANCDCWEVTTGAMRIVLIWGLCFPCVLTCSNGSRPLRPKWCNWSKWWFYLVNPARFYLGSPALATRFLRPDDHAILFEASMEVYKALKQSLTHLNVKDTKIESYIDFWQVG